MIKKQQQFILKGMNQDIAETKIQSDFAYSIKNFRVVTDEKDGTLSLVTEKGTTIKQIPNEFENVVDIDNETVSLTVTEEESWQAYSNALDNSLSYRTYVKVLKFSFYFSSLNTANIECTSIIPKYFSYKNTVLSEMNLSSEYNVIFNENNLTYKIYQGSTDTGDIIDFYTNCPSGNLNLYNIVIESSSRISVKIPVLQFRYAFYASPAECTNITIFDEYKDVVRTTLNFTYTLNTTIGNVLGSCVIGKRLILFTNNYIEDKILKFEDFENDTTPIVLYNGNLNFNFNNPIKTYVSYENDKTIKVYWIDGLNQPRVINICSRYEIQDRNIDNHFDFVVSLYNNEKVYITKKGIGGMFHSGVIQYFMTYVDQNDQESKIFYQSPLYYLADNNRALSPDELSTNSFLIEIKDIDTNDLLRKKLRIYSLQRTSLDAAPVAKLVYEVKLSNKTKDLSLVDTGNIGMNIDAQTLLFLGCDEFVPQTFAVKDSTMFFGNIKIKNHQQISDSIANKFQLTNIDIATKKSQKYINSNYATNFQLSGIDSSDNESGSDEEIKGFMYDEEYMLGLQFLHRTGEWSEPIWVGDFIMTQKPNASQGYQTTPFFRKDFNYTYFTELKSLGYIAVRPLVVFNDKNNSRVLCQGLINPTIKYKTNYYPSWFFRYFNTTDQNTITAESYIPTGFTRIINSHGNNKTSGEVQGFDSEFTIKDDLVTFNSPEIEFEKIINVANIDYKFSLIGYCGVHANNYDIEMLTSTTTYGNDSDYGLKAKRDISWYSNSKEVFVGGFCWKDKDFAKVNNGSELSNSIHYVWPWENNQSYSFAPKTEDDIVYSAPERKIISNYRYSQYFKGAISNRTFNVEYIALANNSYLRTSQEDENKGAAYIKDVDILVTGTPTLANCYERSGNSSYTKTITDRCNIVRIQYKTTPHIILKLGTDSSVYSIFYTGINNGWEDDYGNVIVGELLNNSYDDTTKFKGRLNGKPTETSMYENTWYVAGKIKTFGFGTASTRVEWIKGDTYYQRYDCLKTYPHSHEAPNSIVDVLSCMIQTRVNLDGRYDKNRCFDIIHIDTTNFNKLNDVYTQSDNFFTYHKLDPDKFQNTFSSLITWSKQKVLGESIDSWANIHLVNVLDLDGNLGEISAIKLWNNRLIAFQKKGISVIKYNENAMISQSAGAPIELLNSGLVTGKEYITNQFGCQNEWSIVNAKTGLYFSDDYNHKLYVLSDGIKCISDNLGFKSYLKTKGYTDVWKPNIISGKTLHTFYDQQLGEIYFTDGADCLTFNENLNLFTSFYDYKNDLSKKIFNFINIENKNYWILNNFTSGVSSFYKHRTNNYLEIFDHNCDYSIELTSNIDPHVDKIFDTVEVRGDCYINTNLQSGYGDVSPFDKLRATNEYQDSNPNEASNLTFNKDIPSNVKQKFRIWRMQIGRNQKQLTGENIRVTRDRIRNVWSRIKLVKNATNNLRAKIHDIIVNVYE